LIVLWIYTFIHVRICPCTQLSMCVFVRVRNCPCVLLSHAHLWLRNCRVHFCPVTILIKSDEAHFYLTSYLNKQNIRYWSNNKPMQIHEKPLHSEEVCCFHILSDRALFLWGNHWGHYHEFWALLHYAANIFGYGSVKDKAKRVRNIWSQQDGPVTHTARQSLTFPRGMFPGCLISWFGNIPCPPGSLSLTDTNFFLWGYFKLKVYATCPHSTQELKDCITEGIGTINNYAEIQTAIMAMYQMSWRSSGTCKAWILNCNHYSNYSLKWFTVFIVWCLTVAYRKLSHPHTPLCMLKITCSSLPVSVALSCSRGTTDDLHVFPTCLSILSHV
jgi:hypothetical protein